MFNETLFEKWIEKERKVSSARKRSYAHFDPKFKFENKIDFFYDFFSSPENIERHSFYPFIKADLITPRYKKTDEVNTQGKRIRVKDDKVRPIAYAAHIDSAIYSWYSTLLTEQYEDKIKTKGIYDCVLAYLEKEESNIEFANRVFKHIRNRGECVALAFDVSGFFDNLDHEHLKKMWCNVINVDRLPKDHYAVFRSLTEYSYVDRSTIYSVFPTLVKRREKHKYIDRVCSAVDFRNIIRGQKLIQKNTFLNSTDGSSRFGRICGIPQGSPISACLSNIYMFDFDLLVSKVIQDLGGVYFRYCDDIIVIGDQNSFEQMQETVLSNIKKFELDINDKKTEITFFRRNEKKVLRGYFLNNYSEWQYQNLQYLGFEFNGQNIYIRSSSFSRYYRRMTARIRENLKAAYGRNSIGDKVFKKKLLNRYTSKGERNFITYAQRSARIMQSETIAKQYRNSTKKVFKKFQSKKEHFAKKRTKTML